MDARMDGFPWVLETIASCTGLCPCLLLGLEGAGAGEGWGGVRAAALAWPNSLSLWAG